MYVIIVDFSDDPGEFHSHYDMPDELIDIIDGHIYKQATNFEIFAIVRWLLENDIKYHSIHEDQKEFLLMMEKDAMKFKMRWI